MSGDGAHLTDKAACNWPINRCHYSKLPLAWYRFSQAIRDPVLLDYRAGVQMQMQMRHYLFYCIIRLPVHARVLSAIAHISDTALLARRCCLFNANESFDDATTGIGPQGKRLDQRFKHGAMGDPRRERDLLGLDGGDDPLEICAERVTAAQ